MADRINHQADKIDGLKKGLEGSRFPDGTASFAAGLVTVPRDDFAKRFDVGVPLDPTKPSNDRVVLLYSSDAALPKTVPGMAEEIRPVDQYHLWTILKQRPKIVILST